MEKPVNDVTEEVEETEELETEEAEETVDAEVPEDETEELEDEAEEEELDEEEEDEESFVEAKKRVSKKDKEVEDEDIVEERFYTIPLRKVWIVPRKKRAPKAAREVRNYVLKHMKVKLDVVDEDEEEPERLIIDNEVNEKLWSRGIEKPPRKIRVRVVKDKEGVVTVLLAEGE